MTSPNAAPPSHPLNLSRSLILGLATSSACVATVVCAIAGPLRAAEPPTASAKISAPAPATLPTATAPTLPSGQPGVTPATPAAGSTPRANPPVAAVTSTKVIVLSLRRREISLQNDGKVVGSWPVVIGAPATPTPSGNYKVQNKVLNPKYQSTVSGKVNHTTGPTGPLGDRWIGFHSQGKNDFGIHGTPWPWWVDARAAVSHGCVRMKNEHVRLLFDQVEIGTPVVIKP